MYLNRELLFCVFSANINYIQSSTIDSSVGLEDIKFKDFTVCINAFYSLFEFLFDNIYFIHHKAMQVILLKPNWKGLLHIA